MFLTPTFGGAIGSADGGSGDGDSEPHILLREGDTGALAVFPPLVLVQPLVKDLDHSILLQDLGIESTDPNDEKKNTAKPSKHCRIHE